MGAVGSSIAASVLHLGAAGELLLYDKNTELAEGEALDLADGAAFYSPCNIRVASPEEMHKAAAVVVTAGRGGNKGESRLELLQDNVSIIKQLGQQLKGMSGLLVVVSNPVDVMTYVLQQVTQLPPERVIGTGTLLDTARLRQVLGQRLHLEPRSIHAQVLGEHGDSEFVVWSSADVGGQPLRQWPGWTREAENEVATEVRKAAQEIIKRKGSTNHAIGLATASLLRWALRGRGRAVSVSRVQQGAYGLEGVALSLPTVIGTGGAEQVLEIPLNEQEREQLQNSAKVLKEALKKVGY